jgi:hypothetical protein
MVERLYHLAYLEGDVEFATRGLYWTKVRWKESKIIQPLEKENYLSIHIKFRKSGKFKETWQNGEHAYLDLKTGEVNTF